MLHILKQTHPQSNKRMTHRSILMKQDLTEASDANTSSFLKGLAAYLKYLEV